MKKRRIYSFNIHFDAAKYYLELSKDKNQSEEINSTSSIVFTAFCIEAFLNHIGEHLFVSWKDYLRKPLSPEAKLHLIAENIGIKVDFGLQPFQSFKTLFRFRNAMAHSVTEDLSDDNAKYYLELGNQSWPALEWEKLRTSKVAETLLKDITDVIAKIEKKSKIKSMPREVLSEFMQI